MASVEKLYCGTTACTENNVRTEYGAYCRNKKNKQIPKKKTLKIPNSTSQIDTKFLPGYKIEEIGGMRGKGYGCGFKTVYTKNKDWEGWNAPGTPGLALAPRIETGGLASAPLEAKTLTPGLLLNSINKCCTTFASLTVSEQYDCGLNKPGSAECNDTINWKWGKPGYCIEDPSNPSWYILRAENTPGWGFGQTCWGTDGIMTGWNQKPCYGGSIDQCKKQIDGNGNVFFN